MAERNDAPSVSVARTSIPARGVSLAATRTIADTAGDALLSAPPGDRDLSIGKLVVRLRRADLNDGSRLAEATRRAIAAKLRENGHA
jgi:hypothetical protein